MKTETKTKPENEAYEAIRQAYAKRQAISSKYPLDQNALDEQDKAIKRLVLEADFPAPTEAERNAEPVMAQLRDLAGRRHVEAVRLLTCYGTTKVSLYQNPQGEKQKPDEYVGYNGIAVVIPRDNRRYTVPEPIADILEHGGIR